VLDKSPRRGLGEDKSHRRAEQSRADIDQQGQVLDENGDSSKIDVGRSFNKYARCAVKCSHSIRHTGGRFFFVSLTLHWQAVGVGLII
jgi:hypothetical protein